MQETRYVYGVNKGAGATDSDIYSKDLLFTVHYPNIDTGDMITDGEADTGADTTVTYAYNRTGELRYMKDQNATVHVYTRDDAGRVTADEATRDGGNSDLDTTVAAIGTTYDDFGRVEHVRSYSAYDPGALTDDVLNDVKFTYTLLWQVEDVWQERSGNVDDNGTPPDSPKVTYVYDTEDVSGDNHSRIGSITYPNGDSLPYVYGSGGSSDDKISRLTKLNLSGHPVGYDYVGMGLVAIVDFETPDVQLDRYRAHLGGETASPKTYPGFDRFGRVVEHRWVDGDFAPHGSSGSHSTWPPIVELHYTYDKASNRLTSFNENIGLSGWTNRDWQYAYDGIDRLTQAERGKHDGSFTHIGNSTEFTPGQAWDLDVLGNWNDLVVDRDADGPDANGTDTTEARTHTMANELTVQDLDSSGSAPNHGHAFDKAGNMLTQEIGVEATPTVVTYTHDLWNRLVEVTYTPDGGSPATRSEYTYNGVNWRIMKRVDTNPATSTALDQQRVMLYSAEWQLVQETIDDDYQNSAGTNRNFQYVWGPRYIDELVVRRYDANGDGDYSDGGTDLHHYYLSDVMFSTVAIINDAARIVERVSYDPYGKARHHKREDLNGDGAVGIADLLLVTGSWGSLPAAGDINRDGIVGIADQNDVIGAWGAGPASGQVSTSTTDNVIGWDGYVFNSEIEDDGLYTVRHRHYRPGLGRWVERDPVEFSSSNSLYDYAYCDPISTQDSNGLSPKSEDDEPYVNPHFKDPNNFSQRVQSCARRLDQTFPPAPCNCKERVYAGYLSCCQRYNGQMSSWRKIWACALEDRKSAIPACVGSAQSYWNCYSKCVRDGSDRCTKEVIRCSVGVVICPLWYKMCKNRFSTRSTFCNILMYIEVCGQPPWKGGLGAVYLKLGLCSARFNTCLIGTYSGCALGCAGF